MRPGLAVDAGGVLGQVSPPEGRVVALVASEGRFAPSGWMFYALTVLRLWGNTLGGCQVQYPFVVDLSQMDGTNMLH